MKKIFVWVVAVILIMAQTSSADGARITLATAEKHFLEGRYDIVINESQTLINSGSGRKDELYYLKGLSELKAGRFANARGSFGYIISKYPRSRKVFDAHLGMGDAYLLEGDTAKALSVYNEMAEICAADKNIALVYARLSSCYAKMGLQDKAYTYYDKVRKAAPLSFEAKVPPAASALARNIVNSNVPTPKAEMSTYSVQVGSFKSKRNADNLAKKLAGRSYQSYVAISESSRDKFYRVKVGNFTSKDEASRLASKLKSDGYRTNICSDDACE